MMGVDLSIITSKAQTTRHRILGLINGDYYQLVISDTPGIIKPAYEMQTAMMDFVKESLEDADVLMYMAALGETKIKDVIKNLSKNIGTEVKIKDFKIFKLGEGIEVAENDFAAEVAATANIN